jgi:hypothetical protein
MWVTWNLKLFPFDYFLPIPVLFRWTKLDSRFFRTAVGPSILFKETTSTPKKSKVQLGKTAYEVAGRQNQAIIWDIVSTGQAKTGQAA